MEFDETKPQNQRTADKMKSDVKSAASEATSTAQQKASQTFAENRETIAKDAESLAHAADAAAEDLQDHQQQALSEYVTQFASSISALANNLRHKSIDELMHEAEGIARRNPALFIGGSIAIGLGLARFAKASGHHTRESQSDQYSQQNVTEHATTTSHFSAGTQESNTGLNTYSNKGNGSTMSGGVHYE